MFRRCLICAMTLLLIAGIWGSALAQTGDDLIPIYEAMNAAFNAHDLELYLSYFTDDVIQDYVPFPPSTTGKDAFAASMAYFFQVFPDLQGSPQRVLTSGNILVEEWIATATQQGEFLGIPPSGKSGLTPHLTILEFEGDKVKKATTYLDYVTVMVNTGAMPASELPPLVPSFTLPDPEATGLAPLEANAELITRWNPQDLFSWMKRIHHDAVFKYNTAGMLPLNREQTVALNELFALSNSTLHGEVVRQIDMGDGWVAAESVWRGVHDGPYFGIPASGLPVTVRAGSVGHYDADGLVTDFNFYFDNLGVLIQMGVVPAPGTAVLPTTWGQIKATFQE